MDNINKYNLGPLQAEKEEYILTPDGNLVKTNATKLHKDQKPTDKSDWLPDNSYIFSNDPTMLVKKKNAEGIVYGKEYFNYIEGKNPKPPKELKYSDFINGEESTTATIVKNISKKFPVLDSEQHKDNPFILKANNLNKQSRDKLFQIAIALNEGLRMKNGESPTLKSNTDSEPLVNKSEIEEQPQEQGIFKYGGYHNVIKNYQSGGQVLSGIGSGAAAGTPFGPWGTGIGAVVGGVGSLIVGSEQRRKAQREQAERAAYINKIRENNANIANAQNFGTFAKAAVPLPKYEFLNLDKVIDRNENLQRRTDISEYGRRQLPISQAKSMQKVGVDALAASGADSTQVGNYLVRSNANALNNINNASMQQDSYYDTLRRATSDKLDGIDRELEGDNQKGVMYNDNNRYTKAQQVAGEFTNNAIDKSNNANNLETLDYQTQKALEYANAEGAANAQAQFSAALTGLGNAKSAYDAKKLQEKLLEEMYSSSKTDTSNPEVGLRDVIDTPFSIDIPRNNGLFEKDGVEYYSDPNRGINGARVYNRDGKKFVFIGNYLSEIK